MITLQAIKSRSNTIQNISKALDAIKMVSSVKMSKLQRQPSSANIAIDSIAFMLQIIKHNIALQNNLHNNKDINGAKVIIVLSTMQGFCGALNNLINNEYKKVFHNITTENNKCDIIVEVCGTKHKHLSNSNNLSIKNLHDIDESTREISTYIFNMINDCNVSSIIFIHASSKNSLVQLAESNIVYPFLFESNNKNTSNNEINHNVNGDRIMTSNKNTTNNIENNDTMSKLCLTDNIFENYTVEGDIFSMYESLSFMYISYFVKSIIYKHVSAELMARVTSLDSSVSNANDIYNNLLTKYNKARQTKITQELIEIISSKECMNYDS